MADTWLADVLYDWIGIANDLSGDEFHVYSNLISFGLGKQLSIANEDVCVLWEFAGSQIESSPMNTARQYNIVFNIAARIYVSRANTPQRNAQVAVTVAEKLVRRILSYSGSEIYRIRLLEPVRLDSLEGVEGVPGGSMASSVVFQFLRKSQF